MPSLKQKYIQDRADLVNEGEAIVKLAEDEKRKLSDDEKKRLPEIKAEIAGIDEDIELLSEQEERERGMATISDWSAKAKTPEQVVEQKIETFGGECGFGEFLQAVYKDSVPGHRRGIDERLYAATGASEGVLSDGGFLVQQDFSTEILRRANAMGAVQSRVRRIPISAGSNGLKINAINETSRADGSRWGGVQVYWVCEAEEKTASKPEFRQMELDLKKLAGLFYSTDELLQDAAALQSVAMEAFSEELNFKIEDSIFNGTGAGQMLGIMAGGALITVLKQVGQAAATINYQNVLDMWTRLHARSRPNAVWFIDQSIEPQLYTMSLAVGTGGAPVYVPAGGASSEPYATLFGRPVIPVEYCAALGTTGDICLFDLSQYLMIDKGGLQTASSIHVRFIYDETVFRFVYRVDGQPIWNAALTPKSGGNTQSPFVVLETRS
jgi:HK97 family phage major capsid protein